MPFLVTSNVDDESIQNERASMETPFPHCKSISSDGCHCGIIFLENLWHHFYDAIKMMP